MSSYWINHDGYCEFVDGTGRIVGAIKGGVHEARTGWRAFDASTGPWVLLGRYATLNAAKAAVEARVASKGAV